MMGYEEGGGRESLPFSLRPSLFYLFELSFYSSILSFVSLCFAIPMKYGIAIDVEIFGDCLLILHTIPS